MPFWLVHRRPGGTRRHLSTPAEKIAWLRRRLPRVRRMSVRDIVEAMRAQQMFARTSYWYDCQGIICDFLKRKREPEAGWVHR